MAIEKPEWFKLNPAKFLSDRIVDAMSTLELGACLRLLCRQWIDGDLPDDIRLLARHSRLSEPEMEQAWLILSAFFSVMAPGRRANRFMWVERERVIAELERLSDEGTRLARKRWDASRNADGNAVRMPDAMQDQSRADQTRQEKNLMSKPDGFNLSGCETPKTPDDDHKGHRDSVFAEAVRGVWEYYIETIPRNPKLYTFTAKRKAMGIARLRDLVTRSGSIEQGVGLMRLCVDRLKQSAFHNGKNDQQKKYLDWEILFRSTEQLEKWLDDERWADTKGVA